MGLNESYKEGFINQIDSSIRGEVLFIPNFLDRVGEVFNLMQSRYTMIFGATGSGKTSLADYLFILAPWSYLQANEPDIHWEGLYFSLERKIMFKHAKWISWFIYRDTGLQVSADALMGWGTDPLSEEGYKLVRSYDDEISKLLEHVHLYDGRVDTDRFRRIIHRKAAALGTLYTSDDDYVYKDNDDEPIGEFSDEFIEVTEVEDRRYLDIPKPNKKGTFRIYENEQKYFLHNPRTFVFIVVDGIGLMGSSEFSKKKSTLDTVSEILRDARDIYGFSPVVISQQNRELGSTQRLKLHGSDLSPQLEDIQGSSQMAHDSDLAIALFDPYHYKAFDTKGFYNGYNLLAGMMHPKGFSRFRTLHIIKNSFGYASKVFGLKFVGESNHFETLPKPDDPAIFDIYSDISKGK